MKQWLDKNRHLFEKGGKYEKYAPVYEMLDTFLYNPLARTTGTTHMRDGIDLKRIMTTVVIALIPCVLMALYNTGLQANIAIASTGTENLSGWRYGVINALGVGYDPKSVSADFVHGALYFLPVYLMTLVVGGFWEVLFAIVRKKEIGEAFLVTSLLYPLILPPTVPIWEAMVALSIGLVLGKEVFGGTGRNIVNPALFARAILFFSYPSGVTGDSAWVAVDGYSYATPLATQAQTGQLHVTWTDAFLGFIPGSMGETSTLACIIGALFLIWTGIGSWKIIVSAVIGLVATALMFNAVGSDTNPMFSLTPQWHLVIGGFAFAAAFMATDPVSAAFTDKGKWFYGGLIGVMTCLVRVVNPAYPEGAMLAVLFANIFAPIIDYIVMKSNMARRMKRDAA